MVCCAVCGCKQSKMKRCVRCHHVIYCSKECQIKDWPEHKKKCTSISYTLPKTSLKQKAQAPNISIANNVGENLEKRTMYVKWGRETHQVVIPNCKDNPRDAMELVSKTLCIPLNKLKLICKGKVVTEDNLLSTVFDQAQKKFLAIGEKDEKEEGLHQGDIQTLMEQLNIDRNSAIRGLRHCDGNVINAILHIGETL